MGSDSRGDSQAQPVHLRVKKRALPDPERVSLSRKLREYVVSVIARSNGSWRSVC